MFSQASVILFTGGVCVSQHMHWGRHPPPRQTPPGRPPPHRGRHKPPGRPSGADPPSGQTLRMGRHPPDGLPPGQTPPPEVRKETYYTLLIATIRKLK